MDDVECVENFLLSKVKRHFHDHYSLVIPTCCLVLVILSYAVYCLWPLFLCFAGPFALGVFISYNKYSWDNTMPNILRWWERSPPQSVTEQREPFLSMCTVCGNSQCPRHRSGLSIIALRPWTGVTVPEKVDSALEEFLNTLVQHYIYPWYSDISDDGNFVNEAKVNLRFVAAILVRRLLKVDLARLITDKFFPRALQHIDVYVQALEDCRNLKQTENQQVTVEQMTLNYYDKCLHRAAKNRSAEMNYLKRIVRHLLPVCLPHVNLNCRSITSLIQEIVISKALLPVMDIIADPDVVNYLLLLFFDNEPITFGNNPLSPPVCLLANFCTATKPKTKNLVYVTLSEIINNQQLLYPFIQFLKGEAVINVLQFCFDVDDFNKKILNPDLTESDLVKLHKEASDIFNTYCAESAVDKILFPKGTVEKLKAILDGPPENVIRLRTTPPLFQAYDHAYELLDKTFCPMFHHSDDYFKMICGDRLANKISRSTSSSSLSKYSDSNRVSKKTSETLAAVSKLSNRLKGVFKTSTVDGRMIDGDDYGDLPDGCMPDELGEDQSQVDYADMVDSLMRDLSAWRIFIPRAEVRLLPGNKQDFVYIIEVQRVDVCNDDDLEDSHWTVERRYQEFYALESKLTEFHGIFTDIQLPPKRSFGTKTMDFTESRRDVFEQWLRALLAKPSLRGSELLFNFLTTMEEFQTNFLPDLNFSRIVRSVPRKLRKERGQGLEQFLATVLQSTEPTKPKPVDVLQKHAELVSATDILLKKRLFSNNANIPMHDISKDISGECLISTTDSSQFMNFSGVYDQLIYLAIRVFKVPTTVERCLLAARFLLKSSLESFFDYYLDKKLRQALREENIVKLIQLLQDALFFDDSPPRTAQQRKERSDLMLLEMKHFLPGLLVRVMGEEANLEGANIIHGCVQHPKLNKQLSYLLLDVILEELFPEVRELAIDTTAEYEDKCVQ